MKQYIVGILFFFSIFTVAQTIEKEWRFESIKKNNGTSLVKINSTDSFTLSEGKFTYSLAAKDSLVAEGTYIHQNNLLIFKYLIPTDTVRYYNIIQVTDTVLTLSENDVLYSFSLEKQLQEKIAVVANEATDLSLIHI